jgi:mannitol-1-phosphate 5-dehydrogenase
LPIDRAALVPGLPNLAGVEPVERFEAWEAAKLFLHNGGHAILGYLGCEAGIEFGYEALRDSRIRSALDGALGEAARALARRYGTTEEALSAHVEDLVSRFENESLGDTCFRLARDPIRKLAPHDRLVGAARLVEEEGGDASHHAAAIASALGFRDERDPTSLELAERIAREGLGPVLRDLCEIDPDERLGRSIAARFRNRTP